MRCSVKPKDQIFVQCYGFASFAKNMSKDIGNNISKSLSGRYSAVTPGDKSATCATKVAKKPFYSTKKSVSTKVLTDALKNASK